MAEVAWNGRQFCREGNMVGCRDALAKEGAQAEVRAAATARIPENMNMVNTDSKERIDGHPVSALS